MLATVLYRLAGKPATSAANPFQDVAANTWYTDAVIWCAEQGLVEGYGNGKFGPNDNVTREQMVTILWRYAGRPEPDGSAGDYADESKISDWAVQAVDWSHENEITVSRESGQFAPDADALRYEIASTLMNYQLSQGESEPETTPEPEQSPWDDFEAVFGYQPQLGTVEANSYDGTLFQVDEETGYVTYEGGYYAIGVDVSAHQKEIDWEQVAASGVEFAIIRVGFRGYAGGTINQDSCFEENVKGALSAGLDVGVYFFSQAVTVDEAIEEAEYTLNMIRPYNITYPVVFDWERQSASSSRTKDTDEETVAACAVAFCETVKAAGYTPMFYASPSKAYKMELGYLADYPFWLAHYTTNQAASSYRYRYDVWQYSSTGSVPGITGNVDMDISLRRF
jgi:GH25 family lysozyme M1 (1,4-beta-N-acetylmuramidase)